jgi:hypothetical protein
MTKLEKIKQIIQEKKNSLKDACWKNYEAFGMKEKNGRMVPDCVPKKKRSR